jgi:hypothetical protein
MMYENLVKDLCKRTHLNETRDGVCLLWWIVWTQETMGCPNLDFSRVIHYEKLATSLFIIDVRLTQDSRRADF